MSGNPSSKHLELLWRLYKEGATAQFRVEFDAAPEDMAGKDRASAYLILAGLEEKEGRVQQAITAYEDAEQCVPENTGMKCLTARAILDHSGAVDLCRRKLLEIAEPERLGANNRFTYFSLLAACDVRDGRTSTAAGNMLAAAEARDVGILFQGHEAFLTLCAKGEHVEACKEYVRRLAETVALAESGSQDRDTLGPNTRPGARAALDALRRRLPSGRVQ